MGIVEVDIGTITATIHPTTNMNMVDCCVYLLLLFVSTLVFMETKEVTVGMTMEDVEVGLKISATLPFTMMEKALMVIGEVYIGLRP